MIWDFVAAYGICAGLVFAVVTAICAFADRREAHVPPAAQRLFDDGDLALSA